MKGKALLYALMVSLFLFSCSGDSGGGGTTLQPPTYSLGGTWDVSESIGENTCGIEGASYTYVADIVHAAGSNSMTMTDDFNDSYVWTVSGSSVTYSENGSDEDCPAGFTWSINLTAGSATAMSGSSSWSCKWSGGSCTGSYSIDMSKQGTPVPPATPPATGTSAPTITGFSPASGAVGATVTVTGTNFSATAANNTVKFHGVTAAVTNSTATTITTSVPAGATTGSITVTVNGQTVASATNFTVTGSGAGTSEVEANNTTGTAQVITLPATISGVSSSSSDYDYYKFTVSTTKTVTITLTGFASSADLDLELWKPSYLMATSDTMSSTETITQLVSPGTSYYIKVIPFYLPSSTTTAYTLTVQ